jgi:ORF6N domain-containing protein
MFKLTKKEAESLRSQIAISNNGCGGRRYLPYAITEQGVAMLSSVLNSEQAIEVNVAIMRALVGGSSGRLQDSSWSNLEQNAWIRNLPILC